MQETARRLATEQSLIGVEDRVVTVSEVFRLQGADELEVAERRYLPQQAAGTTAVVLAASRGKELGELTETRPKTMVPVRGKPILEHIRDAYNAVGVKDVAVVRGYRKERIDLPNLRAIDNDEYADTGELWSLDCALRALAGERRTLLVSYGDVLFNRFVPRALLEAPGELVIAVDTQWRESTNRDRQADYVTCSLPSQRRTYDADVALRRVADRIDEAELHGEWTGFLKIAPGAAPAVHGAVRELLAVPENRRAALPVLLNALVGAGHAVHVVYVAGLWFDIDSLSDVVGAGGF
jgi:phosphoenolpyruvate phosphomutase